jgi:hypothetical protein
MGGLALIAKSRSGQTLPRRRESGWAMSDTLHLDAAEYFAGRARWAGNPNDQTRFPMLVHRYRDMAEVANDKPNGRSVPESRMDDQYNCS